MGWVYLLNGGMQMDKEMIKKSLNDLIEVCSTNENVDWSSNNAQEEWSAFRRLIKAHFKDLLEKGEQMMSEYIDDETLAVVVGREDVAELARYRALGELLAALVAPQLDADVSRAVSVELDARDTDDRANDDRERARSAEITESVEAAVTEAVEAAVTEAVTERASLRKIAHALVDNGHLAVESDTVYGEVEVTPEVTLIAVD